MYNIGEFCCTISCSSKSDPNGVTWDRDTINGFYIQWPVQNATVTINAVEIYQKIDILFFRIAERLQSYCCCW